MRVFLRLLIFACASLQLRAADHSQLESSLKQSLVDKPACLARPQTGDNLAFDAQGTCVKCGTPATAATFGNLLLQEVSIEPRTITVKAQRLLSVYEPSGKRRVIRLKETSHISVNVQTDNETVAEESLGRALRVGLCDEATPPVPGQTAPSVELKDDPDMLVRINGTGGWKRPGDIKEPVIVGNLEDGSAVYIVTKAIRPAENTRETLASMHPDIQATKNVEKHGVARLQVVIDSAGLIHSIRMVTATSTAFAINGATAVAQWKFKPGTLNGKPVAVLAPVEVNFSLQ